MNTVRMRNFIEDYIGYLLKTGHSGKKCDILWKEYVSQARGCRKSLLWDNRWDDDNFGVDVILIKRIQREGDESDM